MNISSSALLLGIPFLSILALLLIRKTPMKNSKNELSLSLFFSIKNLLLTVILLILYDFQVSHFQYQSILLGNVLGGLDGISLWLILLVNLIIPIVILESWKTINTDRNRFLVLVFGVNFWSLAVFYALDILLFYISFEALLIPKYYLIGFYGSRNKKIEEAQNKFFIYTLKGSLFFLLAILNLWHTTGTTDYQILITKSFDPQLEMLLFLGFFLAFAIKTPKWPFHIWLPVAHGESSTGTSVILAAILLKFGTYGFIRYTLVLFPTSSAYFLPLILTLSFLSIIYSCLSAFALSDLKAIIAYSSIAHKNVGVIGIFSFQFEGLGGAYLYSISHGLASSGLFLLAGFLYDRFKSKTILYYKGLVLIMPLFVFCFFLFTLSNLSFPLTLGFIAELLILLSTIEISPFVTIITVLVTVLLPFYFIWTYQRISFGTLSPHLRLLAKGLDLNIKEFHLLFPLLFLTLLLGICPSILINYVDTSLVDYSVIDLY